MDLDLSKLGGQFVGARMGRCLVCRDLTVLPAFGDGRCLVCTTDEIGETEWIPQRQILFREPDELEVHRDIVEIFDEAQRSVPAFKVIAGMLGPKGSVQIRRSGLWLPHNRRWSKLTPPSQRMAGGMGIRAAVNSYYKDLRQAHLALGLCGNCTRPALPGLTICDDHMAPLRAKYRDRQHLGLCLGCGGQRDTEHGTCAGCIKKRTASQAKRAERLLAAGLCTACGQRPAAPKWCRQCMDRRNAARRVGPLSREEQIASARRANAARWANR